MTIMGEKTNKKSRQVKHFGVNVTYFVRYDTLSSSSGSSSSCGRSLLCGCTCVSRVSTTLTSPTILGPAVIIRTLETI